MVGFTEESAVLSCTLGHCSSVQADCGLDIFPKHCVELGSCSSEGQG